MPRQNSQDWSADENVTGDRLQDFNEDLDDLYSIGSDIGKAVRAASAGGGATLLIDVGGGPFSIGGIQGVYAGNTDFALTNNATNYVEVTSGGTLVKNTTAFTGTGAEIAIIVTSGGDITSITLRATKIIGGTGTGLITGEVRIWVTDTAPTGFLLCYGQAVSRTTYANLFSVIDTDWGIGDGSTTFNLPDFRGRMAMGQDDMGGTGAGRGEFEVSSAAQPTSDSNYDVHGVNWVSQLFTTDADSVAVKTVTFGVAKTGSPATDLTVEIFADDGSDNPTGSALATATVDNGDIHFDNVLRNDFDNIAVTFDTPALVSASTKYHIVLSTSGGDGSNKYVIRYNSSDNYANGKARQSANSGSTWSNLVSDLAFAVYHFITNDIADTGGESVHKQTLAELVEHNHKEVELVAGATVADGVDQTEDTTQSGKEGGSIPFNVKAPYNVVNFIIKI